MEAEAPVLAIDLFFLAIAVPAVVFAGVSKAGFGSGADFAAVAFLAIFLEPQAVIALMLPLLMLVDAAILKPYWRKWDWPSAKVLILGGLPGVVLGGLLWSVANEDVLRVLIGTIAIAFVASETARSIGWKPFEIRAPGPGLGVLAGVGAGFTSFVSHAGGPIAAVFLLSRGLSKTGYQATTVLVFWITNIAKGVGYGILGVMTWEIVLASLTLAPAALLGAWLGVRAHRAIPERAFFAVAYTLLALAGSKLILDGLG
ncbi:MAG: sulfite exporter TauE/SafE family protein [Paracoccaceae bacterium]|nr:sulfite exporter TauE/SafE family protein [Paracoccaceae bacterium]